MVQNFIGTLAHFFQPPDRNKQTKTELAFPWLLSPQEATWGLLLCGTKALEGEKINNILCLGNRKEPWHGIAIQ